jgi:glycosyltransferase involved in cell wall biosynthesis
MEAMAHGKPVVAFDVGGVRDWLTDQVDGLLVPRGDAEGLATAIGHLLTNPESRIQLGKAAQGHVGERFDRRVNVGRLLAAYSEILN